MSAVHGIIILEGADGTGKTTLARELCAAHGGLYIHNRYHKVIWPFFAATLRWAVREGANRLVVVDRHWVSENVYARAYRGGSDIPHQCRALHRVLLRHGAVTVLAAPLPGLVVNAHARLKGERPEMYDNVERVARYYHDLWYGNQDVGLGPQLDLVGQVTWRGAKNGGLGPCLLYDRFLHDGPVARTRFRDLVVGTLAHARRQRSALELDPTYWNLTGCLVDQTLLVGDRVNIRANGAAPWPFFAPDGCSAYLSQTLHQLRLDEQHLAFTNAHGPGDLAWVTRACGRVVALGKHAAAELKRVGRPADATVRHPQHARRFTHHDDSYQRELVDAVGPAAPRL